DYRLPYPLFSEVDHAAVSRREGARREGCQRSHRRHPVGFRAVRRLPRLPQGRRAHAQRRGRSAHALLPALGLIRLSLSLSRRQRRLYPPDLRLV
ncbi:hypothetical protein PRIPAC_91520, partial [Pristionchus pacificus]